MIGRLNVLQEQDRAVYAWALTRTMRWLEPGPSPEHRLATEALLTGFVQQRLERHFPTRQADWETVRRLNAAVFAEVRAAWSRTRARPAGDTPDATQVHAE
ncbi:hypothetical protein [Deinococcus aerophilus]|nr:hypothetical protein [Deinococcus aerophilus]